MQKKASNRPLRNKKKKRKTRSKQLKKTTKEKSKASSLSFKPPAEFTKDLAQEIVKNLQTLGKVSAAPFTRTAQAMKKKRKQKKQPQHEYPVYVDSSVLIDGRILQIVNSGFLTATLLIPEFVLKEVQHIADSSDSIRRAKGRRGLEVVTKIKNQKVNKQVKVKIVKESVPKEKQVDHKLVALAKRHKAKLMTIDFNLAQYARAQKVKVLSITDLSNALKVAYVPGEIVELMISHQGKERQQGVGYLPDGTMVVVEDAKSHIEQFVKAVVTKIHQTSAGQIFFAKLA